VLTVLSYSIFGLGFILIWKGYSTFVWLGFAHQEFFKFPKFPKNPSSLQKSEDSNYNKV